MIKIEARIWAPRAPYVRKLRGAIGSSQVGGVREKSHALSTCCVRKTSQRESTKLPVSFSARAPAAKASRGEYGAQWHNRNPRNNSLPKLNPVNPASKRR